MAKDEGFQPPTQGPIFGDGDVDQTGQYVAEKNPEVPEGSVSELQGWIGTDKTRAEAVLKSEGKDGRATLIAAAQKVVDEDTGAGIASGEV
jgi:hypothetical protein